ncbi:MAG: PAS domain-containing protein, partial [Persicimonas sp.]
MLAADPPSFTVVDASDAFLRLTGLQRDSLVNRSVFEVFPEQVGRVAAEEDARAIDPVDFDRVRRTLHLVLETGTEHHAGTFRYNLPAVRDGDGPEVDAQWSERYWSPSYRPVFGDQGSVAYILLRVEEVTEFIYHRRYSERRLSAGKGLTSRIELVVGNSRRRTYLAELLSTQWEVDAVGSLEAALEHIRQVPPDLIITELDLHDATGIELLEALAEDAHTDNTTSAPVVLLAEDADENTCARAYDTGFEEVICGIASPRELLARVHAQLSAAALRQSLREKSRRRFREIFMQAPVSIAVLEGDRLVYTLSNPAHKELMGREDLIGKSVYEIYPDKALELLDRFLSNIKHVMVTGEPKVVDEFHYRGPGFEGEVRDVYLTHAYLPVFDLDGHIEGVAVFGVDITEQVMARKQLELESHRKDEFLAMLGHELRNPLTPIGHAAEILSSQAQHPKPERIEWISGVLRRQLDQLADIVDDLLDVARINQGRITLNRGEHRLDEIVSTAVETSKPLVEAGDKHLDVNLPDGPVLICADGARLTQVIANLLNNAVKYTPRGGHIWLEADVEGNELTIEVRDDGKGISPEMLPHVFDLFT